MRAISLRLATQSNSLSTLNMIAWALLVLSTVGCSESPNSTSGRSPSLQWESISNNQLYSGTIAPQGTDIPIGQFHTWEIELQSLTDTAVTDAQIAISGGMPAHGHGLPTAPRVTRYLGNGRYLIEGVRFNMAGSWVLEFQIQSTHGNDRLRFELELQH